MTEFDCFTDEHISRNITACDKNACAHQYGYAPTYANTVANTDSCF